MDFNIKIKLFKNKMKVKFPPSFLTGKQLVYQYFMSLKQK